MAENKDLEIVLNAIESSRKSAEEHNQSLRLEIKQDLTDFRKSCTTCNYSLHTRISGNSDKISDVKQNQAKWLSLIGLVSFLIASFADTIVSKLGWK